MLSVHSPSFGGLFFKPFHPKREMEDQWEVLILMRSTLYQLFDKISTKTENVGFGLNIKYNAELKETTSITTFDVIPLCKSLSKSIQ